MNICPLGKPGPKTFLNFSPILCLDSSPKTLPQSLINNFTHLLMPLPWWSHVSDGQLWWSCVSETATSRYLCLCGSSCVQPPLKQQTIPKLELSAALLTSTLWPRTLVSRPTTCTHGLIAPLFWVAHRPLESVHESRSEPDY